MIGLVPYCVILSFTISLPCIWESDKRRPKVTAMIINNTARTTKLHHQSEAHFAIQSVNCYL